MRREDHWIDPEDAGLRIILATSLEITAEALREALAEAPVAAVIAPSAMLQAYRPICRSAPCALLVRDDISSALTADADGLHLGSTDEVADARTRLGAERLLGADARGSRHAAMIAGEAGADYVMFGNLDRTDDLDLDRLVEVIGWWSELFVLPCAAAGAVTPAMVPELARAGADFIAVGPALWQDQAGAPAALRELALAIERASDGKRRQS